MHSTTVAFDTDTVRLDGETVDRAQVLKAAAVAALLGLTLVFTTGFAHPEILHNAAHDSRHAMNFPCH